MNSSPLSINIFLGPPQIAIQFFINALVDMILLIIIEAAIYLVNSSVMCMYHIFGFKFKFSTFANAILVVELVS